MYPNPELLRCLGKNRWWRSGCRIILLQAGSWQRGPSTGVEWSLNTMCWSSSIGNMPLVCNPYTKGSFLHTYIHVTAVNTVGLGCHYIPCIAEWNILVQSHSVTILYVLMILLRGSVRFGFCMHSHLILVHHCGLNSIEFFFFLYDIP